MSSKEDSVDTTRKLPTEAADALLAGDDVYRKLFLYGSISQKQRDAVVRAVRFPFERVKEARRKALSAQGAGGGGGGGEPLPVGDFIAIEGTVRKVQERDTAYGTRMAIVVSGEGWAVWGYSPRFQNVDLATGDLRDIADLYDLVGERVRFYAAA